MSDTLFLSQLSLVIVEQQSALQDVWTQASSDSTACPRLAYDHAHPGNANLGLMWFLYLSSCRKPA